MDLIYFGSALDERGDLALDWKRKEENGMTIRYSAFQSRGVAEKKMEESQTSEIGAAGRLWLQYRLTFEAGSSRQNCISAVISTRKEGSLPIYN